MPGIFFTNLWMLAGLAALSIPIIIHLLLRRKKKRARFSTLQFFLRQDEQSSQRRKLRHWLLLSLRLAICALLVLAFARPYLENRSAGDGTRPRRVLLVLDQSLSMQAGAGGASAWTHAVAAARQILDELKPDDRAALIGCGARAETLTGWAPPSVAGKILEESRPSFGGAGLGEGLLAATTLLAVSDPAATTSLVVIGDLQQHSIETLADCPLPPDLDVKWIKVGDLLAPNLALTDLQIDSRELVGPHAVVTSFSDEETEKLALDLRIDGQLISSSTLTLSPGASTNVDLAIPALKPGWHDVTVQMKARDSLSPDDTRYQTLFVPPPARVLIVEPRALPNVWEEETFFVRTALDPGHGSENALPSRFVFETVGVESLSERLRAQSPPFALVVLPGLRQLSEEVGQSLAQYLQAGGGLMLFAGEGVSANRFNAEFRPILPFQLGATETAAGMETAWRLGSYDTNSVLFEAFPAVRSGNLSLPRFLRRFQLTVHDPALVVARFDDQAPAVLAGSCGGGRFVLVNSSADTSWNDWPKFKSFVPFLHGAALFLARLPSQARLEAISSTAAGEFSDADLGPAAAGAPFHLQSGGKRVQSMTANELGILRDLSFFEPGVYSLHTDEGAEVRRIAVNVPPQESNLTSKNAAEAQQHLRRLPEPRPGTLAAGLFGSSSNHREIWRVLLVAVLVLLMTEMFLANRTLA